MTTPLLGLSEVSEGVVNQATIHNTALRQMEARSFRVLSLSTTTPAVSPAESDSYIIPSGATGVWAGKTNQIASWIGGAWVYYTPVEGIGGIWVNDLDTAYSFDGSAWVATGGSGITAPFSDSTALVKGSADPTKVLKFEVDGFTTATTRTVTVPNKSGTMAMLDDVTATALADGDKGDIVVSASGATWTFDSGVVSAFARSILDDADAAAVRATIGAGTGTGSGDVTGPSSATGDHVAFFNGSTGKIIKDSGLTLSGTNTGDQTLNGLLPSQTSNSGKYLTTDGTNASWATASGGGGSSIVGTAGAQGGDATATGGASSTSGNAGGNVLVTGGAPGATGVGGAVTLTGAAGGTTSGNGGAVTLTAGAANVNGNTGGAVSLTAGRSNGAGTAASLALAGNSGSTSGNATLSAGACLSGGGGAVIVKGANAAASAQGGAVTVTAGDAGGGANAGGAITLTAGLGGVSSGPGGALTLAAGAGGANADLFGGVGGVATLTGGKGSSGSAGGNVVLKPGLGGSSGAQGNTVLNGNGAALATTATGGFTCLPTCAGTPTGTPANIPTGTVPMVFDTSGAKIWIYTGGAWKGVVVA